jgi:hypothetical protein
VFNVVLATSEDMLKPLGAAPNEVHIVNSTEKELAKFLTDRRGTYAVALVLDPDHTMKVAPPENEVSITSARGLQVLKFLMRNTVFVALARYRQALSDRTRVDAVVQSRKEARAALPNEKPFKQGDNYIEWLQKQPDANSIPGMLPAREGASRVKPRGAYDPASGESYPVWVQKQTALEGLV